MAKASENVFPKVQFSEETAPATPSSGQAVVYVDTSDGKLKKKDDAGTVVDLEATGGGGGGGDVPTWVSKLDTDSGAVTTHDDFDNDSFTGWTTVTVTGGQTITEARDVLSITPTSAIQATDSNCILIADALSVGEAVEVAVVGWTADDGTNLQFGPLITDGTTTAANMAGLSAQTQGLSLAPLWMYQHHGTITANGSGSGGIGIGLGGVLYMRLEYEASNTFIASWSLDGVTWLPHTGGNLSKTMTPSHVGFQWNTTGDATTGLESVAIDYVRVVTV